MGESELAVGGKCVHLHKGFLEILKISPGSLPGEQL